MCQIIFCLILLSCWFLLDEKEAIDVCLKGEFDSNNEGILEFLSAY